MTYYIKALVQHCLPLRFINRVIPEPSSWNGMKYTFVYVHPKLMRELHDQPAPENCSRFHNAWEYYFIGWGFCDISLEALIIYLANHVREDDWTFSGDGIIPLYLSHLFTRVDEQNGGVEE